MLRCQQPADPPDPTPGVRRVGAGLIGLCGAYQFALGYYFIAVRPALLPEDLRFLSASATLATDMPKLETWLNLVFTVLGGQMAAVGALTVAAALRLGNHKAVGAAQLALLGAAGVLSVGAMSAVNFALESDFRWLLILPVGAWTIGLALALPIRSPIGTTVASGQTRDRDHAE